MFYHLTTKEGLLPGDVSTIVQDDLGRLWIGSNSGVSVYDGRTIENYNDHSASAVVLASDDVKKIYTPETGKMWITYHDAGMSLYNLRENEMRHFAGALPEVNCFLLRSDGTKWFGTREGLFYLSENEIRKFPFSGKGTSKLEITCLYEDDDNRFWVGSSRGLILIDADTQTSYWSVNIHNDDSCLSNNHVTCIEEDVYGRLWVGTGYGLNRIVNPPENKNHYNNPLRFSRYFNHQKFSGSSRITVLLCDSTGRIWVGTETGILSGNANSIEDESDFTRYLFQNQYRNHLNKHVVNEFLADGSGKIWARTSVNGGLFYYDESTDVFTKIQTDFENPYSFRGNVITAFFEDSFGNLHIAARNYGLNTMRLSRPKFKYMVHDPEGENGFIGSQVYATRMDGLNRLWIGTNEGISILKTNNDFIHVKRQGVATTSSGLPGNIVGCFQEYEDEGMLIGFYDYKFSLRKYNGEVMNYIHEPEKGPHFTPWSVRAIERGPGGNFWIGSTTGGIAKFCPEKNSFRIFRPSSEKDSMPASWVQNILFDGEDQAWLASKTSGLIHLNMEDMKFKSFKIQGLQEDNQPQITSLCEWKVNEDYILVGTLKSGLYRFHKKSGLFNPVGDSENAVENVYDILSDNHGSYWVSSDKGILKFDPYLKYNDSYFFGETMIGTKFNYGAASKDQNGWMYFGGDRVIIKFHPDSVQAVETKPFVYFSNFRLFGQDVAPDDSVNGRLVLDKNINYLDTLHLSYNQNDLTFVMQAINFSQPVFQDFRYRLVGFDNQWKRSIQGRAEATYTNLDFGEYMLRVETVAGQEASPYSTRQVFIVITPPWYQTTWFRLVFVLFVVGLVFLINYLRVRHLKMQKKMLSMQVDKKTMELRRSNELLKRQQIEVVSQKDEIEKQHAALKEMSERLQHALQSRLKLFTNISHEFRTPLTLLIGPLENIIYHKRKYPDMEVVYRLMYRNAKRLLELVNQLLDLRRIDSAKMKVKREKMDIVPFVNEVVQAFHDLADQKSIDLKFCADSASDFSFIDADKTEKILYNILSNAFKFTPDGGEISVCLNKEIHKNDRIRSSIPYYKIEISDTGTGIPAHHVEQIFDRFCHFEGNNSAPGSGIGLALTKELIEVLGGTIQVSSKPGEGTHFSVSLPVINNVEALEHGPIKKSRQKARAEKELELPRIELPDPFNQNPIIQIVEDDQDVLFYLVNELQPSFQILIARNGSEGVKLACQYIPDIIISDVMMPEMDGEHMTRIIKNNELTSHIPVVLLTAKDNEHGIIEGLESGAIDYITKPFNQKALRLKIDNILRNRQKLHYKIKCNKSSESLSGMDRASQDFLLQIDRLIEKNIQNPELNTDFFAKQMNCSKTTFYRKLKNLSGSSVNVYVRNKRIETAAILIKNNDKSVSEVAYDVGFNDPAYFSRCFKEYFKKSPRAYS